MKNVTEKISSNVLTLEVDLLKRFGPSSTGKSTVVASSDGFVWLTDSNICYRLTVVAAHKTPKRREEVLE